VNPLQRAGALLARVTGTAEKRDNYPLSFQDWIDYFSFNGTTYPVTPSTTITGREEQIAPGYEGLVNYAYQSNGIVFASELARIMLFSQARFQWQQMANSKPGKLFGTPALAVLETPWPGGTTQDLLAGMIQDADLAGNSFTALARTRPGLVRLRPDWVTIIAGSRTDNEMSAWHPEAQVLGYLYHVGGRGSPEDPIVFLPEQVAHFAPIPDPLSPWRGLSWLNPVIAEVKADTSATRHKLSFFENGATVNLAIVTPAQDVEKFKQWVTAFKNQFEQNHRGALNAYKTLYLGAGADAKVVGANMQQMEFAETQAAGENRITMASGVPAIVAGASKGLDAGTYANFAQFRRTFGDRMHWLWGNACGSLQTIVPAPTGVRLWYDAEHIPFLREDSKDQAAVQLVQAQAIRFLVDAGYEPDPVVQAVTSGDFSVLTGAHTGLFSVQLQPAGAAAIGPPPPPAPVSGAPPGRAEYDADMKAVLAAVSNGNGHHEFPQNIDVTLPEMRTQVDVYVPESRVEVASPQVTVQMPEQPAPVVNVHPAAPEVRVDVPPQPTPEVTVNVAAAESPEIKVEVPAQEPPVVNVNVPEAPEQVAPEVHVDVHVPEQKRTRKRIERDKQGRATGLIEEPE
jgi:phage portal protein BeeE